MTWFQCSWYQKRPIVPRFVGCTKWKGGLDFPKNILLKGRNAKNEKTGGNVALYMFIWNKLRQRKYKRTQSGIKHWRTSCQDLGATCGCSSGSMGRMYGCRCGRFGKNLIVEAFHSFLYFDPQLKYIFSKLGGADDVQNTIYGMVQVVHRYGKAPP